MKPEVMTSSDYSQVKHTPNQAVIELITSSGEIRHWYGVYRNRFDDLNNGLSVVDHLTSLLEKPLKAISPRDFALGQLGVDALNDLYIESVFLAESLNRENIQVDTMGMLFTPKMMMRSSRLERTMDMLMRPGYEKAFLNFSNIVNFWSGLDERVVSKKSKETVLHTIWDQIKSNDLKEILVRVNVIDLGFDTARIWPKIVLDEMLSLAINHFGAITGPAVSLLTRNPRVREQYFSKDLRQLGNDSFFVSLEEIMVEVLRRGQQGVELTIDQQVILQKLPQLIWFFPRERIWGELVWGWVEQGLPDIKNYVGNAQIWSGAMSRSIVKQFVRLASQIDRFSDFEEDEISVKVEKVIRDIEDGVNGGRITEDSGTWKLWMMVKPHYQSMQQWRIGRKSDYSGKNLRLVP